jgi:hypothetical protein
MWFFQFNNCQNGPINIEVVKDLLAKRTISGDTLVWKDGMNGWSRLADSELASLIPESPAPTVNPATVQKHADQLPDDSKAIPNAGEPNNYSDLSAQTSKSARFAIAAGIILFVVVFGGAILNNVHKKYNTQQTVIISQCESVLPILTRRYQTLGPFLELFEKQDWNDRFYVSKSSPPPAFMQPDGAEPTKDDDHDVRVFTPRNSAEPNDNALSHGFVSIDFTALHEGCNRFINGSTAFEKIMGATEIEDNLPDIISVATNSDAINNSELTARFRSDLSATGQASAAGLLAISQSIEHYNDHVANDRIAKMLTIPLIDKDSTLATQGK